VRRHALCTLIDSYSKDLEEGYFYKYSRPLKATGNYETANSVMRNYFSSLTDQKILIDFEKDLQNNLEKTFLLW
jgi:hypothetical protein